MWGSEGMKSAAVKRVKDAYVTAGLLQSLSYCGPHDCIASRQPLLQDAMGSQSPRDRRIEVFGIQQTGACGFDWRRDRVLQLFEGVVKPE